MELYWTWYVIALILVIISIIIWFSYKFSIRGKNLEKVWLNYSFFLWRVFEWEKPWFFANTFSIIFNLLINPLLSWISVFFAWYWYIKLINEKITTPEKVKEIQYKLWHNLYSKEEVLDLLKQIAEFNWKWKDFENYLSYSDEEKNLILQDDDYWYFSEITIIDKNKYQFYYHSPDYDTVRKDIVEFKIDWNEVFCRTISAKVEHPWEEYYEIQDNIVIKSEIRKQYEKNEFLSGISWKDVNGKIGELEKECEWNEVKHYKIKYFLLKEASWYSKEEINKIFRSELEKLKEYLTESKKLCEKYKLELEYNDEYKEYVMKNTIDEKELKKFEKEEDKISKKYWYENYYFYYIPPHIDELENYLETKVK